MSQSGSFARHFTRAFVLTGVLCLAAVAWLAADTLQFTQRAVKAEGQVVALVGRGSMGRSRSTLFAPRIEFVSASGATVRFVHGAASSPPAYDVGEVVPVLYERARPERARIGSFWSLWLLPLVFTGVGVLFLWLGTFAIPRLARGAATTPEERARARLEKLMRTSGDGGPR